MSFIINQNFDLKSPQFNFARDYFANVASLKAASENDFPDHFITNVAGTLYQLTKSNSVDTTTGKWRKIKLGSDVDLSGYATTAALNNKVDKVSGKGLSTNDFTEAYKTKLNGIAEGANKTTVDSSLSSSSVNPVQNNVVNTALNSKVNTTTFNGLKTNYDNLEFSPDTPFSTSADGQQFIGLAFGDNDKHDNKSIVEIYTATQAKPGIMSTADKKKLDGIAEHANNYSLPVAGTNLGGIKLGYSASGKNYPVQLDSTNKAYVYVPWTDTDTKYSLPTATDKVLGGIKTGFQQDDANHNYPIALNTSSQAYVNVPLATYNILNDTGQKDGLITGAERRAIHLLSLSGLSLANDGGFQLTLNGVLEDNNGTVVIPFATSDMNDTSYGLMKGSDKNKLDTIEKGANKTTITGKVAQGDINAVSSGGVYAALSSKVDKVTGKGLSTNDFTEGYKIKLDNITSITKSEIDKLFT
jgi:hypothetical protein